MHQRLLQLLGLLLVGAALAGAGPVNERSDTAVRSSSSIRRIQLEREDEASFEVERVADLNFRLNRPAPNPTRVSCTEPDRSLYRRFLQNYRRDRDFSERRAAAFRDTLQRTILFNEIIRDKMANLSQDQLRPGLADYHYIESFGPQEYLWYADVTDCELGLIKSVVFGIIDLIEDGQIGYAYETLILYQEELPLLNADGWQQLANILIVRLFDRIEGDQRMSQLMRWPLYLEKLASYAYARKQTSQPEFVEKLAVVNFVYPNYFKDLKYNMGAMNRTLDNLQMKEAFNEFAASASRNFESVDEYNRRYVYFRKRWALLKLLLPGRSALEALKIHPSWLRLGRAQGDRPDEQARHSAGASHENYRQDEALSSSASSSSALAGPARHKSSLESSPFSDLSDLEFVALMNQDYSLLGKAKDSERFLNDNFRVQQFTPAYRRLLAAEIDLRLALHKLQRPNDHDHDDDPSPLAGSKLTRKVVRELISEVGLPMGPRRVRNVSQSESVPVFEQLAKRFRKSYWTAPMTLELSEQRQSRLDEFQLNYGQFKAWFLREGLDLSEAPHLLRLADMSWYEIKFTLFRLCCLAEPSVRSLAEANSSVFYLASNSGFLCSPLEGSARAELQALELYYYYSVHFNKHHFDADSFNKAFETFRYNVNRLRRFSCKRSLTVEWAIRKQLGAGGFSSIDSLDVYRIASNDINLDRYKYFTVPNLNVSPEKSEQQEADRLVLRESASQKEAVAHNASRTARKKANRLMQSFFLPLLELYEQPGKGAAENRSSEPADSSELLWGQQQEDDLEKYRLNRVPRVYNIIRERIMACMKSGRADEAAISGENCRNSEDGYPSAEFQEERSAGLSQSELSCTSMYLSGLKNWNEGLLEPSHAMAGMIKRASCQ